MTRQSVGGKFRSYFWRDVTRKQLIVRVAVQASAPQVKPNWVPRFVGRKAPASPPYQLHYNFMIAFLSQSVKHVHRLHALFVRGMN
jgi:hypothetical protein